MKRALDILGGLAGLVLLSLPMLGLAVAVRLESPGPALHWSQRVGRRNHLFPMPKFRTMRLGAPDVATHLLTEPDRWVTPLGGFLRRTSLDELPQLWSVLKGDMSLVGPRPERPYFVDKLTQEILYYAVRQSVKPGVTGWAQVRYHYGASVKDAAEKLQYDLYYVKNHSLLLDLVVLFETVGVVLMGKGAQ